MADLKFLYIMGFKMKVYTYTLRFFRAQEIFQTFYCSFLLEYLIFVFRFLMRPKYRKKKSWTSWPRKLIRNFFLLAHNGNLQVGCCSELLASLWEINKRRTLVRAVWKRLWTETYEGGVVSYLNFIAFKYTVPMIAYFSAHLPISSTGVVFLAASSYDGGSGLITADDDIV